MKSREFSPKQHVTCNYCQKRGHAEAACRKKLRADLKGNKNVNFIGRQEQFSIYHKQARINKRTVPCFIDFGSESTLIRRSVAKELKLKQEILPNNIILYGFNSSQTQTNLGATIDVVIDGVSVNTQMYIVNDDDIRHDLLIGHTFTEHPSVLVIKTQNYLQMSHLPITSNGQLGKRFAINFITDANDKKIIIEQNLQCGPLKSVKRKKLYTKLVEYKDRFSFTLTDLGKTETTSMKIDCLVDKPIVYNPYRLSLAERKEVKVMIDDLLENGIIRESESPYSSPILLVKKKDGGKRLCVDFRALNQITKKDRYPLPLIDDHLDRLGGAKYFITLDMASGYYQVPMSTESIEKTAFVTPDGHYEFLRMPFGLANACAVFQRLMHTVLGDLRHEVALVYIDDVIIPAKSFKDGLLKLQLVLQKMRDHNLTLKLSKCSFFESTIEYLGREVSVEGIRPSVKKIAAVSNMPRPNNIRQLRQFLGLAGYFRKFVKDFAILTQPLTKLLKKDAPWEWTNEQDKAVNKIKEILVTRPILAIFNPERQTEVHTDASKVGLGAILIQIGEEQRKHVIAYYSRQTTVLEQKYHSYELETLAVLEALRHFRVYLIGIRFKLITDCSAIRSTAVKKDIIPRIGRWWMELQDFDFAIEYRPGVKMAHVDCLSRNPPLAKEYFVNNVINVTEADWLQAAQLEDEEISRIRDILESKDQDPSLKVYFDNYTLREGKVHRKLGKGTKWVVPRGNRWQICKLCHDDMGHFGFEKTLSKIQENYWFAGMRRFVKKYVDSCLNCLYYKSPSGRKPGMLHPIPKVPIPFHTIHLDHVGPFVKSRKRNTHILVAVDGFTKFCIIEAVRSTKSKYVIRIVEDIINIFGVPIRIITDRGSAFTSKSFKSFCVEYGIKHVLNAVATPRANGQCERFNRTILSSLAALNGGKEDDEWDLQVKTVQRGLNTTLHKTLGTTPSELLYGCKPRSVPESLILTELQNQFEREDLATLRTMVQDRLVADQVVQKRHFDARRAKSKAYKVGDLVMVAKTDAPATGESKKLNPKFKGPFRITSILANDRYAVVQVTDRYRKCPTVVCVDKMKPWVTLKDAEASPCTGGNV